MLKAKRTLGNAVAAWAVAAGLAHSQTPPATITSVPVEVTVPSTAPATVTAAPTTVIVEDNSAGYAGRLFGRLEYLLYEFRDGPAPALIQTLPSQFIPPGGGQIDSTNAITIFGDGIRQHGINGGRAELGYWFTDSFAFEVAYSQFEEKTKSFRIDSPGEPSIGRYYYNITNTDRPITYLIFARPGMESGFIDVSAPVQFWNLEANVRTRGYSVFSDRTDYLVGFRYADLNDSITIQDAVSLNNGSGISVDGQDSFAAKNRFYGINFGFNSIYNLGAGFTFDITGKIAFGGVDQQVDINGYTNVRENGVLTQSFAGHILTQPSNIGSYERTQFAVMPELNFRLGYAVGRFNVGLGYNVMAISSVMRAGSAIDENVNPNQSPVLPAASASTDGRPAFIFRGTDFWAQGLSLGFGVNY